MPASANPPLPVVHVARHGETAWTLTGQHTGRSDIPLTERGDRDALALGVRLRGLAPSEVWTSPLARARRTAALAGFGAAEAVADLAEWDYGELDGLTTRDYWARRPGWDLFRDGCPGGEGLADIAARADRVIARLRAADGHVLVFSHGHFLRVLAARWIGLDAAVAAALVVSPAALGALGYEHARTRPAIRLWNDTGHLAPR